MMTGRLPQKFFAPPTLTVAKKLLGAKLFTCRNGRRTSGMIVEVEAYRADIDEACHGFRGRTTRNEVLFWDAGYCYVYFIYGMYHCVNVVTEKAGLGAAVLIRALEPLEGLSTMQQRRATSNLYQLTSGPGKLCQALAIDSKMSGQHFLSSKLIGLEPCKIIPQSRIGISTRIGISKSQHLPWRFFIKDNPWVSRAPKNKS